MNAQNMSYVKVRQLNKDTFKQAVPKTRQKWPNGHMEKKTAPNQSSPEKCKLGRLHAVTLLHAAWLLWKQRQKQKQSQWRGGCGEKGSPVHCGEDSKLAQTFSKTAWGFLEELKIEPPYDPAILLLGI